MDVLISGAGIAGPCLAWWLLQDGHRATIVEKAPRFRPGGYVIDFWGKGYDLAERMGLMPRLEQVGYHVNEVRFVDAKGRRRGGFDVSVLDRITHRRFITVPRGELSRAIFEAVEDRCETIFGDQIASLELDRDGTGVTLEHGGKRFFDLVVGAEGIHSRTRELLFGPEDRFERFLGYNFAAFTLHGFPRRDPAGTPIPHGEAAQKALIRERFAGMDWEVPAFLEGLEAADDLYFDRVSQIRMEHWHQGDVALLGDAAYAPSFLAGQGSALAMIGGYVLAGELKRAEGDVPVALANYQRRLFAFMRMKQDAAIKLAPTFVPNSNLGLLTRMIASRLLGIPWFADWVMGRSIQDQIELPDYF